MATTATDIITATTGSCDCCDGVCEVCPGVVLPDPIYLTINGGGTGCDVLNGTYTLTRTGPTSWEYHDPASTLCGQPTAGLDFWVSCNNDGFLLEAKGAAGLRTTIGTAPPISCDPLSVDFTGYVVFGAVNGCCAFGGSTTLTLSD